MYLSLLGHEKKHLFLGLEICMSKVDSDFSDDEKRVIDAHCMEMHIDNNNYECEHSFDVILAELADICNMQEKRIIFIELVATVMADGIYHNMEKSMIDKLASAFEISAEDVQEAIEVINDMKSVYQRFANFVKEA